MSGTAQPLRLPVCENDLGGFRAPVSPVAAHSLLLSALSTVMAWRDSTYIVCKRVRAAQSGARV